MYESYNEVILKMQKKWKKQVKKAKVNKLTKSKSENQNRKNRIKKSKILFFSPKISETISDTRVK